MYRRICLFWKIWLFHTETPLSCVLSFVVWHSVSVLSFSFISNMEYTTAPFFTVNKFMFSSCFYLLMVHYHTPEVNEATTHLPHIKGSSSQDGSVVIALSYLIFSEYSHKAMSLVGSLIYMDVCIICQTVMCKLLIRTLHSPPQEQKVFSYTLHSSVC